jgi:hypothetical protein
MLLRIRVSLEKFNFILGVVYIVIKKPSNVLSTKPTPCYNTPNY